jgi:hypothetical protein
MIHQESLFFVLPFFHHHHLEQRPMIFTGCSAPPR